MQSLTPCPLPLPPPPGHHLLLHRILPPSHRFRPRGRLRLVPSLPRRTTRSAPPSLRATTRAGGAAATADAAAWGRTRRRFLRRSRSTPSSQCGEASRSPSSRCARSCRMSWWAGMTRGPLVSRATTLRVAPKHSPCESRLSTLLVAAAVSGPLLRVLEGCGARLRT